LDQPKEDKSGADRRRSLSSQTLDRLFLFSPSPFPPENFPNFPFGRRVHHGGGGGEADRDGSVLGGIHGEAEGDEEEGEGA